MSLLSLLKKNTIKTTSLDSNHDRNSSFAARSSLAPTVGNTRISPAAKRDVAAHVLRSNVVKPAQVGAFSENKKRSLSVGKQATISPVKSSLAREPIRCKAKPDSKKASLKKAGTGPAERKFIPWC